MDKRIKWTKNGSFHSLAMFGYLVRIELVTILWCLVDRLNKKKNEIQKGGGGRLGCVVVNG